ncbi:MAG TPA: hypothetical protein VNO52_13115 [Methylomirabilota bacterium]|nr:hypothetical protein [Methylomirabilota bacterium]
MFVPTKALLQDKLNVLKVDQAVTPTTSKLFGAKIGLFTNAVVPSKDTVLADLTEANYTGYAQSAAVQWSNVFDDLSQKPSIRSQSVLFKPTGNAQLNTIRGAFLVAADGVTLLGVELFNNPIVQGDADDGFTYACTYSEDPNGNHGLGLVA